MAGLGSSTELVLRRELLRSTLTRVDAEDYRMSEAVQSLVRAIAAFYAPETPADQRNSLARSLEAFQNSLEAWNGACELLVGAGGDALPILMFAAQTLKHKIFYDWRQLDTDAAAGLRQRLWEWSLGTETAAPCFPAAVHTQLHLALAAVMVQMQAEAWPDPVSDLLKLCGTNPAAVLAILAVVPEALGIKSLSKAPDAYKRLVDRHINALFDWLFQSLQQPQAALETKLQLLNCLRGWLENSASSSDSESRCKLIDSPMVLQGLFDLLLESGSAYLSGGFEDLEGRLLQLVECCADILCEIVYRVSAMTPSEEDLDEDGEQSGAGRASASTDAWYAALLLQWLPLLVKNLVSLIEPLQASLRDEDRIDLARPLLSVILETGKGFMATVYERHDTELLQLSAEAVLRVVECDILSGGGLVDRDKATVILESTFDWWTALEGELTAFRTDGEDVEAAGSFVGIYRRLFASLLRSHLSFRSDMDSLEEIDQFRDFRHIIGDCLKDCVRVLGATEGLLLILPVLAGPEHGFNGVAALEAGLFALRTISSAVDARESEAMPQIVPLFSRLLQVGLEDRNTVPAESPVKLAAAVLMNVGCYAEWLRYHSESLPLFLGLIGESLKAAVQEGSVSGNGHRMDRSVAESIIKPALQSLKYVSDSVGHLLKSHYGALEELMEAIYAHPSINTKNRWDLIAAVVNVLGRLVAEPDWMNRVKKVDGIIWSQPQCALQCSALLLEGLMTLKESEAVRLVCEAVLEQRYGLLNEALLATCDEDEADCWMRCWQAVLHGVEPQKQSHLLHGHVLPFAQIAIQKPGSLAKRMALELLAVLVTDQLITAAEFQSSGVLEGVVAAVSGRVADLAVPMDSEFRLLRAVLMYVVPESNLTAFVMQSGVVRVVAVRLGRPARPTPSEIMTGCALVGCILSLLTESASASGCQVPMGLVDEVRGVVVEGVGVSALNDWPLVHVVDLAMVLVRCHQFLLTGLRTDTSGLSEQLVHKALTASALSAVASEQASFHREVETALCEASRSYRPRRLRQVLTALAETCRRRHGL